jgi:hypothetical protein
VSAISRGSGHTPASLEVSSTVHGTNAHLLANVARLYIADGDRVADVTYGKGVFWHECDTTRFRLFVSDSLRVPAASRQGDLFGPPALTALRADLRALPYRTGSLDVVVLDPPYIHNPGNHVTDRRYNNRATTKGMYHADILRELYCRGIQEAYRVLRPAGRLFVKGKDEIESGEQCWSHRELYDAAVRCGFTAKDLFVLHAQATTSALRWDRQLHARKNHSYLWVFVVDPAHKRLGQLKQHGGGRRSVHFSTPTTVQGYPGVTLKRQRGTSTAYLTSRLLRDHPDIYSGYQAGEYASIKAAARAAGIVKARKNSVLAPHAGGTPIAS